MVTPLPLFPLNTVVFPGQTVPLHIFEERYRALVRDLKAIESPDERLFGIVAIREGYEVGGHEARSMYRTGCVMRLTRIQEYDDGRFDIATIGVDRMRVLATDSSGAYLRCEAEVLSESDETTEDTAQEAARALAGFAGYRDLLSSLSGSEILTGALPRDPTLLSYVLSAACPLPLTEQQRLLEAASPRDRLAVLRRILREEVRAMSAVPSLPATDVARSGWSPN